jgi:hypothetical protein
MNQELAMLNSAKKLFLLVVLSTLAGCGGWLPIFKSQNAAVVSDATRNVVRSEESVPLYLEPVASGPIVTEVVVSEPPVPEESLVLYTRPLAAESPIPEPTRLP